VKRLMFVALSIEIGLVLLVIPWSSFWERNYFAQLFPPLHTLITNHFVRGAVSGIGLINLSVGLAELVSIFTGRAAPRHVSVNPSHLAND
jgi:hypothetical protein